MSMQFYRCCVIYFTIKCDTYSKYVSDTVRTRNAKRPLFPKDAEGFI